MTSFKFSKDLNYDFKKICTLFISKYSMKWNICCIYTKCEKFEKNVIICCENTFKVAKELFLFLLNSM